jgi:PAS domain-containing protein
MRRNPVAPGEGLCGWVAKFHQPLLVADAALDKRFRKDIDEVGSVSTRSAMCLPLLERLDLVGVMEFFNKGEGSFIQEDMQLAQSICQHTALTMRRLRLEGMVHRVTAYNASILDNLSGGFLAVDLQGRLMICNPAARRILEVNGDVTDVPVEKALPQLPELATVLRQTLSSKQIVRRKELDWTYQDKKRRLGYSTLLIQDPQGRFVGAGITFQDLTQLK